MEWAVFSGILLAVLSALTWGAYKYGRIKEKQTSDEIKASDMTKDAEIVGKPYVNNPLSKMRPK